MRIRVFPSVGDELALQNAADAAGVRVTFSGPPQCDLTTTQFGLSWERVDGEGNKDDPTEWFVAYLDCDSFAKFFSVYSVFMRGHGREITDEEFDTALDNWVNHRR